MSLTRLLRCPVCSASLRLGQREASCSTHVFPVEAGIPRLLPPDLMGVREGQTADDLRARTYRSFGYEWSVFSAQLDSYEGNFHWYLEPLGDQPLTDTLVLDAGCGMGRHTHHFLARGAEVVALDASPAVDIAAANNRTDRALFLQADVLQLPLQSEAFDLVCCLGVLHHVDDTARGVKELTRVTRPGGNVLIYVYHDPSETSAIRGWVLRAVGWIRRVTTRLPLPVLRAVALVFAVLLYAFYVTPLRIISQIRPLRPRATALPLGQYVDYPFRVLWNDQFDRFSAPLEKRYRRAEVETLLRQAGLEDLRVLGGYGWRAAGRKPGAD